MQDCNGWMGVTTLSWYFKTNWNVKHIIPHTGKNHRNNLYFSKTNLNFFIKWANFCPFEKNMENTKFFPRNSPMFFSSVYLQYTVVSNSGSGPSIPYSSVRQVIFSFKWDLRILCQHQIFIYFMKNIVISYLFLKHIFNSTL